MDANNILRFPENKIVRKFENSVIPKPSMKKDIEVLVEDIMDHINNTINMYDMGENTDKLAFKEYCLVQQAVLAMVQKMYGEESHNLQEFADYYISITSQTDDGNLVYTATMPSLAFLDEGGADYTIVNFEEE